MKGLILALHWAKLRENRIKAGGKIQFGCLSKSSSPSLNQKQNRNWDWHSFRFTDTCTMNIHIFTIQDRSCDWLLYISLFVYSSCDVWCLLIVFNCNKRLEISTFVYFANTFALKAVSNTDYLCILAVLQGDFNCSFPKSSKHQKVRRHFLGLVCLCTTCTSVKVTPSHIR